MPRTLCSRLEATARGIFAGLLILGALALISASPPPIGADALAPDERGFIADLHRQAIPLLGPKVAVAERLRRFRQLFDDNFDVAGLGRFTLGRYWPVATPYQRQEFLRLFAEFTVRVYSERLDQIGPAALRITGSRIVGDEIVVQTEFGRPESGANRVDWFLVSRDGGYKVTDVSVNDVSLRLTERHHFAEWIERNGGRVEAVLAVLRQQLEQE